MARIVFYTKPGCSLCEDARALLDDIGEPYETRHDPRFDERVPVVEVDGEIVAELRIDQRRLRRALKRAARRS